MQRRLVVLIVLLLAIPPALAGWPQFRHDNAHTGHADESGGIRAAHERFAFAASGAILSSPAVADVGGAKRIFVASYVNLNVPGTITSLRGDGTVAWSVTPLGSTGGYVSSPTVADLDGVGDPELVIASLDDSRLRAFNARTGASLWTTAVGQSGQDLLGSSPVVADLLPARAGREIALGGSLSGSPGNLLVFGSDGTILQSPVLDGPSWSTPLVADLDGDGEEEIAIATGLPEAITLLFPSAKTGGRSLYVFDRDGGSTWSQKWVRTLSGASLASPAVGDVDGDGDLDVVIGAEGGTLSVFDARTGSVVGTYSTDLSDTIAISSPLVFDTDADGRMNVLVGTWDGIASLEWRGTALGLDARHRIPCVLAPDATCLADSWVLTSTLLGDVDGDGALDVAGATTPVRVDVNDPLSSDALPGTVFVLRASDLSPLWTRALPEDGSISGPVLADVDGDGLAELLVGEGIPLIGEARALHVYAPANPVIRSISSAPSSPSRLDAVRFSAVVSDENTPASGLSYAWSFGHDGETSTAPSPLHTFPRPGSYTVSLTVTDDTALSVSRSLVVTVVNLPPTAAPQVSAPAGALGATLDANAADADGTVAEVRWDLGDGTQATGPSVSHGYASGGTYDVVLTVEDDDGAETELRFPVSVNRFPTLDGPALAAASEATPATFRLAGADPDGDGLRVVAIDGAPGATWAVAGGDVDVFWTPPYDVATPSNPLVRRLVAVTVEDGGSPPGRATHAFEVDVAHTDQPPTIQPIEDAVTMELTPVRVLLEAVDHDGEAVSLSMTGLPPAAALTDHGDGTGAIEWTPDPGDAGSYLVVVAATSLGLRTERAFTLLVAVRTEFSVEALGGLYPGASPGVARDLPVRVTNEGTRPDTFTFRAVVDDGWIVELPAPLLVPVGESAVATLRVVLPPGSFGGPVALEVGSGVNPLVRRALAYHVAIPVLATATFDEASWTTSSILARGGVTGTVRATFLDGSPAANVTVSLLQTPELARALASEEGGRTASDGRLAFAFDDLEAWLSGRHDVRISLARGARTFVATTAYLVGP